MKQKLITMTALLLCFVLIGAAAAMGATAAVRYGDRGPTVKTIQTKLKNWGYYSGTVDSVFGSQTQSSVIWFQKKNGLTPDGVVGTATANKLGISLPSGSGSSSSGGSSSGSGATTNDVNLLAKCIYGEGRGEPYKGKVAIGAVILNRVKSSSFPNSISGVIYQPGAFDVVADGQINLTPDSECLSAARDALNGWDPTGGCLFYYNPKKTSNAYILSRKVITTIGDHRFAI